MKLDSDHIAYIERDIAYRGIVDDDLGEELVDHICEMVDQKMLRGMRFIEAYDEAIADFGNTHMLQHLQIEKVKTRYNNTKIMVKNYFKIAMRNLAKHRFYSFINIAGLSIGVACSIMIILYVINEKSYDSFHEDGDRMYRLTQQGQFGENEFNFPVSPAPMGPTMIIDIPEVEDAVRMRGQGTYIVRNADKDESFKESGLIYADPNFFEFFTFPLVEGDKKTALESASDIAISETVAQRYFNNESPIGKRLILDGDEEYLVKAVFEDMPSHSHIQLDFIMSMEGLGEADNVMWVSNNFYTYVKLRPDANLEEVKQKVQDMKVGYMKPQIEQFTGTSYDDFLQQGNFITTNWQPMDEIYLTSAFTFDLSVMGNEEYVNLFMVIALFIIVLACINFMNLSTARSTTRAKEVGVRKVLGSLRAHLIRQFLMESILMSVVAFMLGIVIVTLTLPLFNDLAGKSLEIPWGPAFAGIMLLAAMIIGILAGLYPALFLSSFRPVNILKGRLGISGHGGVRNALVVFQFFISIILITGTIAINRQLNFIQNKKIGFEKDQVILVQDTYMLGDQRESFKKEVEQMSTVESASYSGFIPVSGYNRSDNTFWREGLQPTEDNLVSMQRWVVDEDYISALKLNLIYGRNFEEDRASDSSAVILNETAYRRYGFTEGEENWIATYAYDPNSGSTLPDVIEKRKVIGVIEDFHFEFMKENITPLGLLLGNSSGTMAVRVSTDDFENNVDLIRQTWENVANGLPFNYSFLDEAFGNMYRAENQLAEILTLFAALAIFIGCLGLFGLASYMAERRTKEIGIRKVMGASVNSIVMLLSQHFSKLLLISFLLATPLAWWAISKWLEGYNYHIDLGIGIFLIAGLVAFLIAGATVAYQSIRAAISNPVKSLRNE